jgi:preprotein translocase subunit SecY
MSLLIFTQIAAVFPSALWQIRLTNGWGTFAIIVAIGLLVVAARRLRRAGATAHPGPVRQADGRPPVYGGTSTYIPLKVNQAGVIPVIFASSLLYLPALMIQFTGQTADWQVWIANTFTGGAHPVYMLSYAALIIFFTYFYVSITFNPTEVADNMKKYGGFIPGIRAAGPPRSTSSTSSPASRCPGRCTSRSSR